MDVVLSTLLCQAIVDTIPPNTDGVMTIVIYLLVYVLTAFIFVQTVAIRRHCST